MTVCKYFLQDRCVFGNNCRFEHPVDKWAAQNITGGFGAGASAFGSKPRQTPGAPQPTFGSFSELGAASSSGSSNGNLSGTSAFGGTFAAGGLGGAGSGGGFGQFGNRSASFGAANQQPHTSAFGERSVSAFGQCNASIPPAFGATSSPSTGPSTVGQPLAFNALAPSSFGGGSAGQQQNNILSLGSGTPFKQGQPDLCPPHVRPGQIALGLGTIDEDLRLNRPIWKASVFGPAKYEPNLIASCDLSQEELRLQALEAAATNCGQEYTNHEANIFVRHDQAVARLMADEKGAVRQAEANRSSALAAIKAVQSPQSGLSTNHAPATSVFGAATQQQLQTPAASAFGQPSAFGSTSSTAPAFGTTSAFGGTSGFGQTSAFGSGLNKGTFAFGADSQSTTTSTFGAPSTPGVNPAGGGFGAFGAGTGGTGSNATPSTFGTAAGIGKSASASAFGQSSAFGQTSAFGLPSAFGAASKSDFGSMAVQTGRASQPSAFGSTTADSGASDAAAPSAFGTSSPAGNGNNSSFGALEGSRAPSAFGTASVFGFSAAKSAGITLDGAGGASLETAQDPYIQFAPKESDLPPTILELFKADQFEWGAVPGVEPPVGVR